MSAKAQRLRLRLFVEGVEIPCISAQVASAPNSPVMASIQIPPLAEGTRFLPRSLVHLFFFDFNEDAVSVQRTGTSITKAPGPSAYEQSGNTGGSAEDLERDMQAQHYKVLFVGELVGFAWSKRSTSRSLVLQCQDLSNYWDHAFQFNNTNLFGPGYKALFSGGSTNLFTDLLSSPGQIAKQILMTPSARYPAMRGLLGGLIHLLEAMGGTYYYEKKYAGQNIFFSLAELRLHITQLITAYDKDPTARRLLGGGWESLFGRSIGNLGDQASFRKILNKLAGIIFHETYGQPCPLYVPGTGGTVSGFVRKNIRNIPKLGELAYNAEGLVASLKGVISAVDEYLLLDKPKDPRALMDFAMDKAKENIKRLSFVQRACHENARKAESLKGLKSETRSVQQTASQAARYFKTAATHIGKAIAAQRGRKVPDGKTASGNSTTQAIQKAISELQKIAQLEATVTPAKQAVPGQLKQQIFRPDVWFSAPPRCNVFFPDQYFDLNYSRSFLSEPTRLLLKTHDEFFGEDILFDNFYFAPKALTLKSESNKLRKILQNDILDHELFTGILPVFEKMGEFNIFAARSGIVDGKTPKIGMAQRAANFLYFKYRFAARQMQVTARFNPYVACGFPGLIIDKYVDLETVMNQQAMKNVLPEYAANAPERLPSLLGTHFLANFTDVMHQVDQSNGVTTLSCSYARQVEESVEFLGAQQEEVISRKTRGPQSVRTTRVAALFAPRVGQQGPNRGRIVSVVDVSDAYRSTDFDTADRVPLLGGSRDARTRQLASRVPIGFARLAKDYGNEVATLAGDPNIVLTFRAFDVTETAARERKETVFLPPEEYIRPGWYGSCWHPAKISEVYYDFFDIGAITETTEVTNFVGANAESGGLAASDAGAVLEDMRDGYDLQVVRDQVLALSQTKSANIQEAVSLLVLTYSVMRQGGFDADQFIKSYTWRPIASMLDIFGTSDLVFSEDGSKVLQGVEGFHSRAFGIYEDLFGLVPPEVESIVGIRRGTPVAQKVDTRKRKRLAVLDYAAAIASSRAILG